MPYGLDMNDVGYARGGAGIDSPRTGRYCGGGGEWHFHEFGETLGLFALDVREGSAGLQVCSLLVQPSHGVRGGSHYKTFRFRNTSESQK